jgi:death on curing protein
VKIRYLTPKQLLRLHYLVMERYGENEQAGILFEDRFHSVLERPQMVVFEQEIHPTLWQKAGALVQSIVQEHPFHNGNKRTALATLDLFLRINGYQLNLSEQEAIDFMVRIATDSDWKGNEGPVYIGKIINSAGYKIKR